MKLVLIAAALAATPVLAQTTTPTDSSGMNGTTTGQTAPGAQQTGDQSMPSTTNSGQMTPNGTPMGGFQPQGAGTPGQPGAPMASSQSPSPSQAFPAPAAMDHYPPCKPGQYDQCMQVSDMHGAKHRAMKGRKPMRRATAKKSMAAKPAPAQ